MGSALKVRNENISKSLMIDHDQDYNYSSDFFGGEGVSGYEKVKDLPLGPHDMPFVIPVQSDTCGGARAGTGAGAGVDFEPKYDIYDFTAHCDKDGYSEVDVHNYSKVFEDAYSGDVELSVPALSYLSDCGKNAGYARTYFEKYINRFADLSTSTGKYNYYISGKNKPKTF